MTNDATGAYKHLEGLDPKAKMQLFTRCLKACGVEHATKKKWVKEIGEKQRPAFLFMRKESGAVSGGRAAEGCDA